MALDQKDPVYPQVMLEHINETLLVIEGKQDELADALEKLHAELDGIIETLEGLSEELQELLYNEKYPGSGE